MTTLAASSSDVKLLRIPRLSLFQSSRLFPRQYFKCFDQIERLLSFALVTIPANPKSSLMGRIRIDMQARSSSFGFIGTNEILSTTCLAMQSI